MYLPSQFIENDRALAVRIMRDNAFATIFTHGAEAQASHAPTLVDDGGPSLTVRFHLALQNPQCEHLGDGAHCLITFLGPTCYISPTWYTEHPNVPTWNYVSVHAYGRVSILDSEGLEQVLIELSRRHEAAVRGEWNYQDLPLDFRQELLAEIRGFSVEVTCLEAKSKLSQNRLAVDRERVMRKLLESQDPSARAVGQWMVEKFGRPGTT